MHNTAYVSHLTKLYDELLFQEDGHDLECQCEEERVPMGLEETLNVTSEYSQIQCLAYIKSLAREKVFFIFSVHYIYVVFPYGFVWAFYHFAYLNTKF